MKYRFTVKLPDRTIRYDAIGDRGDLMNAAYDKYGVCGVTVRPL